VARLHPIFHISLMKKFHGHYNQHCLSLLLTTSEFRPDLQPEKVLATRVVIQGSIAVQQLLIQWQHTEATKATWEFEQDIRKSFPTFNLEEKVVSHGEGNVTCNQENEKINYPSKRDNHKSIRQKKENVLFKYFEWQNRG